MSLLSFVPVVVPVAPSSPSLSSESPKRTVRRRRRPKPDLARAREVHALFNELEPTFDAAAARRKLTVKTVFDGLETELVLLRSTYARLHASHTALATYPMLGDLVTRLTSGRTNEDKHTRTLLVAAIVAVNQRSPHRLWTAVLLRCFRPMLCKVWDKLVGAEPEERLALLLSSFQEALRHVDPHRDPIRIGMYVRQATRRRVFTKLGRELDWDGMGPSDADPDAEPDPLTIDEPNVVRASMRRGDRSKEAHVDLVGTLGHHGALWDLVRREHPTASKQEQARIYSRLRERRRQIVARMRGKRNVEKGAPSQGDGTSSKTEVSL